MNHPFTATMAGLALKQANEPATDFDLRLSGLFSRLFQRAPDTTERELARSFMSAENDQELGWQRLTHALMLTNEFIFVD